MSVCIWGSQAPPVQLPERFQYSEVHMGVRVVITGYSQSRQQAEAAVRSAYERIAALQQVFSDFRPDSEAMRLVAKPHNEFHGISETLAHLLSHSLRFSSQSEGAFDVTCGPVVQLWRQARRQRKMPSPEALTKALAATGWRNITLSATDSGNQARLNVPGMRLDFGGIAKGFAADEAIRILREAGIDRALVVAGGDIVASGPPPGKLGWRVLVRGFEDRTVWLRNRAVSTSGDAEQYVVLGGKRYSHIVDPRTGIGLTNQIQATVFASSGLISDALATAACVLGPTESQELLARNNATAWFR